MRWDINSKYLQKDEIIEYTDRPSMFSCILAYIWAGFMIFGAIMMFIISITTEDNTDMTGTGMVLYVFLALPAIYVILKRLSTCYAISNKGVLKRTGIITTTIKTVPFKNITSIKVKKTIAGKIFGYAHLL